MPDNEQVTVEGTEELSPSPSDNGAQAQAGATEAQEPSGGEGGATEEQEAGEVDWRGVALELAKEDPEAVKEVHSAFFDALPEEERKRYQPDAQVAEREHEAELRDLESQQSEALKSFTQRHMSFGPQSEQFVTELSDALLKDLPDILYDESGSKLAKPSVGKEAHVQKIGRMIAQSQTAQAEFLDQIIETIARRSLVDSSAHKLLTTEQRKAIKEVGALDTSTMEAASKWFSTMMGTYIDAALDTNPVKRAEAEAQAAEKKASSAERLQAVMEKIQGRKTKVAGPVTGTGGMSYEKYMALPPEEYEKVSPEVHRQMYDEGVRRQTSGSATR